MYRIFLAATVHIIVLTDKLCTIQKVLHRIYEKSHPPKNNITINTNCDYTAALKKSVQRIIIISTKSDTKCSQSHLQVVKT